MAKPVTFKSDTTDYYLDVKLGVDRLPLSYQFIEEFYIVQDLNKFLPSFRLRIRDADGFLSHLIPFDRKAGTITVVLGSGYLYYRNALVSAEDNIFLFDMTIFWEEFVKIPTN